MCVTLSPLSAGHSLTLSGVERCVSLFPGVSKTAVPHCIMQARKTRIAASSTSATREGPLNAHLKSGSRCITTNPRPFEAAKDVCHSFGAHKRGRNNPCKSVSHSFKCVTLSVSHFGVTLSRISSDQSHSPIEQPDTENRNEPRKEKWNKVR